MIRTRKSDEVPESLNVEGCNNYDGQDVQKQLLEDHDEKCYLCEQKTGKSFQIEHLRAKAENCFPELEFEWTNLFLSCPYCNGRKPNSSKKIHPPHLHDIELLVEQRIDFPSNKIKIESLQDDEATVETIFLIDKLLNGKNGKRDVRCQTLFNDIKIEILFFMKCLGNFRREKNLENKQIVIDCLNIKKEFLGLKFWMIKDNQELFETFEPFMIWNRSKD